MKTPAMKAAEGLLGVFALILIVAGANFLNLGSMSAGLVVLVFLIAAIALLVLGRSGKRWTYLACVALGVAFVALGAFYATTGVIVIGADQLWLFIMSQVVAMLVALESYVAYEETAGPKSAA